MGLFRKPKPPRRAAGESDLAYLTRLAEHHLPRDVAAEWLTLLRPAVHLVPAAAGSPATPVVARLGGNPVLPPYVEWPVWEGHGPLSFVGEVDLAALAALRLDAGVPLPASGRLACFYFDGAYDDFAGVVGTWDLSSLAGARLLHLTGDPATSGEREAPDGVPVFAERLLTARQAITAPDPEQPALRRLFAGRDVDAFHDALYAVHEGPLHRIGGWAMPVQGPVENEVALAALGLGEDGYRDPRVAAEAAHWRPLLQVDSDDEAMWGDAGMLYWLARDDDLRAGNLDRALFTWQCG